MAHAATQFLLGTRSTENVPPLIELLVGAPVPILELPGRHPCRLEHALPCIIPIPVAVQQATFAYDAIEEPSPRIWGHHVKRGRLDAVTDRPIERAIEDIWPSPSIPNTKLPFTMTPLSWTRRIIAE